MMAYKDEKEILWDDAYTRCVPYLKQTRTALDLGCRDGEFASRMKDFNSVHSFDFRNRSKTYYLRCPNKNKFVFHHTAIGDTNGYVWNTSDSKVGRIKDRGEVKIPVTTVDSYNFNDVDFMKIDVEGYETKCVQGAEHTIKKYFPVIIIEQNKGDFSASELLKSWGYIIKDTITVRNKIHDYIMTYESS
jgi:FkbM family methyltransferase